MLIYRHLRPCKCGKREKALLDSEPNAKSYTFQCTNCGRKTYGHAQSPRAQRAAQLNWDLARLRSAVESLKTLSLKYTLLRSLELEQLQAEFENAINNARKRL